MARAGIGGADIGQLAVEDVVERFEKIITQTSRFSRAIVHSDWIVHRRAVTDHADDLASGQATAAPTATGPPKPIEPPMLFSQSCGGAPWR